MFEPALHRQRCSENDRSTAQVTDSRLHQKQMTREHRAYDMEPNMNKPICSMYGIFTYMEENMNKCTTKMNLSIEFPFERVTNFPSKE